MRRIFLVAIVLAGGLVAASFAAAPDRPSQQRGGDGGNVRQQNRGGDGGNVGNRNGGSERGNRGGGNNGGGSGGDNHGGGNNNGGGSGGNNNGGGTGGTGGGTGGTGGGTGGTGGGTGGTGGGTNGGASGYVVIGWQDLGMHCLSPRFKEMAILPPYNDLIVQVIKKGNPPELIVGGVDVTYQLINNASVTGKTDFWTYASQLFGLSLSVGVGLTGNGLSGTMQPAVDHFEATGIPVLPYDDAMTWNPYQTAKVTVSDLNGSVLATTTVVTPTSDEMNCAKCHATGGVGSPGISTPTLEGNILTLHDQRSGTNLMGARPVLCGQCHSDNALKTPGLPGVSSLSLAMHGRHSRLATAAQPGCYDCHPGAKTQCNRSSIEEMGPSGTNPNCDRCHGNLTNVATTVANGRVPWLQEPTCAQCHGQKYSTGSDLYRHSVGHGGLRCSACHNSPHAWWPSRRAEDNIQPIALQGKAGSIGQCTVCHITEPTSGGVH